MYRLHELAKGNLDGCGWYDLAADQIRDICIAENWDISYFTGILSVTSPRVAVRRNVRMTLEWVGNKRFLKNTMKGIKASVEHYDACREIRGPKTSAFYSALMGDRQAVVLDVHMANAFRVDPKYFKAIPRRERLNGIVRNIAWLLDIDPRDAQACIWYGQKRSLNENPEGFPILEEYRNWLAHGRQFPESGYIRQLGQAWQQQLFEGVAEPMYSAETLSTPF